MLWAEGCDIVAEFADLMLVRYYVSSIIYQGLSRWALH